MKNRYKKIKLLSHHSSTQVWLAEDELTDRKCIVKIVSKHADKRFIKAFKTEAEILSRVFIPGIPNLIDVFENEDTLMLTESFIEGISLESWIKKCPSNSKKLQLFKQLMGYLDKLYVQGYLYLDLKSSNLIVSNDELYLIDFNGCIPVGQIQVDLASQYNYHPSLLENRPKDLRDEYPGIGHILFLLFPKGRLKRFSIRLSQHEIQSFKNLKNLFRKVFFLYHFPKVLIGFLLILSVFFSSVFIHSIKTPYKTFKDTSYFISDFNQDLNKQPADLVLIQWLDNGWIKEGETYEKSITLFLSWQAIKCNNPAVSKKISQIVEKDLKEENAPLQMMLKMSALESTGIDNDLIVRYLQSIKNTQYPALALESFLQFCIYCDVIVPDHQLLLDLIDEYSSQEVYQAYLEYGLYIKSKKNITLPFYSTWSVEQTEQNNDLIAIWKEVNIWK